MKGIFSWIIRWFGFAGAVSIPEIIGLAALWIFAEPAEMHEIYRSAAERDAGSSAPIAFGLLSLVLLSVVIHSIAEHSCDIYLTTRGVKAAVIGKRGANLVSLLLSTLPWLGVAFGLRNTARASAPGIEQDSIHVLRIASNLTLGVLTAAVIFILVRILKNRTTSISRLGKSLTALGLAVLVLLTTMSISCSQVFGAISAVALFLAALAIVLIVGSEVYRKYEIPLLPMLLVAYLVFSYFDLNDDHRLRTIPAPTPEDRGLLEYQSLSKAWLASKHSYSVDDIFNTWLADRRDFDAYKQANKPYPVYVIAAQGGGIYAAYHTAAFLAALEDRCPTFAQHVFVISGVSGGSVGSAVFASLVNTQVHNDDVEPCISEELTPNPVFANQVDRIMQNDFLSPVLSGALFPDFLQQFLPVPFTSLDRSRRLERSLEDAWANSFPKRPDVMRRGMGYTWTFDGPVPGLIFNTTAVDSGRPTLISSLPFPVWSEGPDDIGDRLCSDERIPLSTAALASARFPWVTPAAWLPDSRCPKRGGKRADKAPKLRLVDGGYYENSGTETAQNVIQTLRKTQHPPSPFVVKLIVISSSTTSEAAGTSLPELLSPIRAFLSVREERTRREQRLSSEETCNQLINFEVPNLTSYRNCLDFRSYEFPLGWKISAATRTLIKDHIGLSGRCWPPDQLDPTIAPEVRFRMANVCTTMEIMRDLNPGDSSNQM